MIDPAVLGFATSNNPPSQAAAETNWRERGEAVDLMCDAAQRAIAAIPGPAADRIGTVIVPRGSWSYADAGRIVAERLGLKQVRTISVELGVLQTTAIAEALRHIDSGETELVLVVGAEARFRGLAARIAGEEAPEVVQSAGTEPDVTIASKDIPVSRVEIDHRLVEAVDQYAMVENARRRRHGWSLAQHQDDIDALAVQMHAIAAQNDEAWFAQPRPPGFFRDVSSSNRTLALPYNKWHSTQWNVDQGAALLIGDASTADALGLDRRRLISILGVANSDAVVPLSERVELDATAGTRATVEAVLQAGDASLDDVDYFELYSCFPAAVRLQQEALGLDHSVAPTITGGMAFAGGPFNNAALQGMALMCDRLVANPGTTGVVTAFSGMVTKQGAIGLRSDADDEGARRSPGPAPVFDATEEVLANNPRTTVVGDHVGDGVIATYTVRFADGLPANAVVLADLADGTRALAVSNDAEVAAALSEGEWLDRPVSLDSGSFTPA